MFNIFFPIVALFMR